MFSLNENHPENLAKVNRYMSLLVFFFFFFFLLLLAFLSEGTCILFFLNKPIIHEPDYVVRFTGFSYISCFPDYLCITARDKIE